MPDSQPLQPDENAPDEYAGVPDAQTRRAYQKPVLVTLGAMRDVTLSVSQQGNSDGGRTGNRRYTGRGGHYGATP